MSVMADLLGGDTGVIHPDDECEHPQSTARVPLPPPRHGRTVLGIVGVESGARHMLTEAGVTTILLVRDAETAVAFYRDRPGVGPHRPQRRGAGAVRARRRLVARVGTVLCVHEVLAAP
jgi:hypothetical protein